MKKMKNKTDVNFKEVSGIDIGICATCNFSHLVTNTPRLKKESERYCTELDNIIVSSTSVCDLYEPRGNDYRI